MSLPAKIIFGSSCVFALGIISYVHYKQQLDREQLHEGVIRDVERRQRRKAENLFILQKQLDLTKELRDAEEKESSSI